jgi:DNA-binding response OmpR family regulator
MVWGMMPKILIVDDEPEIVDMLQTILDMRGYETLGAYNGVDGLLITRVDTPDLIILDMMLPDMEGVEVCKQVRADPSTAGVPVVFLSARTAQTEIERGLAAGANAYMTKPLNLPRLFDELKKLIPAS